MNKTLAAVGLSIIMTSAAGADDTPTPNAADSCVKMRIDGIPYASIKDLLRMNLRAGKKTFSQYMEDIDSLREGAKSIIDSCEEIYQTEPSPYSHGYVDSFIEHVLDY